MPFRLDEFTAKMQFITFAAMPALIRRACERTETPSQTRYMQEAVCRRLADDLDMDLDALLALLPPTRGRAAVLFGTDRKPIKRTEATTAVSDPY